MDKYEMSVFNKKQVLKNSIKLTTDEYRPHNPASYLYGLTFKYGYEKKFSKDFFELLYATLGAWNMNSRGAKLSSFEKFSDSILSHKRDFDKIKRWKIKDLEETWEIKATLKTLFEELNLVETKTPLVTFTKTLHFILPDLIAPIDRKYTMRFFYGKNGGNIPESIEKQFEIFWKIETAFSKFAQKHDLSEFIDSDGWNRTVPKVLDNAVIGFITPTVIAENEQAKQKAKAKK